MTLVYQILRAKLNPLQAKWLMELALISGFCIVKRMRRMASLSFQNHVNTALLNAELQEVK